MPLLSYFTHSLTEATICSREQFVPEQQFADPRKTTASGKTAAITPYEASMSNSFAPQPQICVEGESLACLLKSIEREIESARRLDRDLPYKFLLKQQFSIGVNEVTRVLERMPPVTAMGSSLPPPQQQHPPLVNRNTSKASPLQLQAILLASDCTPNWLTKHLPNLASSRNVPLISVKDNKGGSLRLGELVKLKTAMAIGVKVRGNDINKLIEEILRGSVSTELPGTPCQQPSLQMDVK